MERLIKIEKLSKSFGEQKVLDKIDFNLESGEIVAYPFIEKILKLFLLSETRSFLIAMFATISIFALFYLVVYTITSKTYYRIIKEK